MATDLEPVEVDPAQLRKTAWKLVLVMVLGAAGILAAYKIRMSQQAEANPDRPPIVSKISKKLKAQNQHGKLFNMYDLVGKVWFAVPVAVNQLDENRHALEVMQELEKHYLENEEVHLVLFSIEGADQGVGPDELAEAAQKLGMNGPRTWFLTTGNTDKQRGFIKDQMRLGIVSEHKDGEGGGKWKFPSQVALVDREMHLRQRYDFKDAVQYQDKALAALERRPGLKDEEGFDKVLHAVDELKKTLYKNTEFVLKETQTGSHQ